MHSSHWTSVPVFQSCIRHYQARTLPGDIGAGAPFTAVWRNMRSAYFALWLYISVMARENCSGLRLAYLINLYQHGTCTKEKFLCVLVSIRMNFQLLWKTKIMRAYCQLSHTCSHYFIWSCQPVVFRYNKTAKKFPQSMSCLARSVDGVLSHFVPW